VRAVLLPLAALLGSAVVMFLGSGLLNVLVPTRAGLEGFSTLVIGLLGAAFYAGFAAGSYLGPAIVARAGHIRAFAAAASVCAATGIAFALVPSAVPWLILRVLTGLALATLYMVVESWLADQSPNHLRGRILSIYTVLQMGAITAGQMAMALTDPTTWPLFAGIAIAMSLSLIPVAMTRFPGPAPIERVTVDLARLWTVSPVGLVGGLATGSMLGAFFAMTPRFAQEVLAATPGQVALLMSAVVVGGVIGQWPLGRWSDRVDRRRVIIVSGLAVAAAALVLMLAPVGPPVTYGLALALGTVLMPLYSLVIAHANDYAEPEDFVPVSGGLLMLYGIGAIVGPLISGGLMTVFGPAMLMAYLAAVAAAFVAFVAVRMRFRSFDPESERADYVFVPRSSAQVFEMDPRREEEQLDLFRDWLAARDAEAQAADPPETGDEAAA
jgi:MFS family permease